MPTTPDPFLAELEHIPAWDDDATDPRENPCPECPEGEVVSNFRGVGTHSAVVWRCSAGCGWTA